MEHSTLISRITSGHIAGAPQFKSKGAGKWDKARTIAQHAIRPVSFRFFPLMAAWFPVKDSPSRTPTIVCEAMGHLVLASIWMKENLALDWPRRIRQFERSASAKPFMKLL